MRAPPLRANVLVRVTGGKPMTARPTRRLVRMAAAAAALSLLSAAPVQGGLLGSFKDAHDLHSDMTNLHGGLFGAVDKALKGKSEEAWGDVKGTLADFFMDQTPLGPILNAGDAAKKKLAAARSKVESFVGRAGGTVDAHAALVVDNRDRRHFSRAGIARKERRLPARVSASAPHRPGSGRTAPATDPWGATGGATASKGSVADPLKGKPGERYGVIDDDELEEERQRAEREWRARRLAERTREQNRQSKGRPGGRYGVIDDDETGGSTADYRTKLGAAGGRADYAGALGDLEREAEERERQARLEEERRRAERERQARLEEDRQRAERERQARLEEDRRRAERERQARLEEEYQQAERAREQNRQLTKQIIQAFGNLATTYYGGSADASASASGSPPRAGNGRNCRQGYSPTTVNGGTHCCRPTSRTSSGITCTGQR